MTPDRLYHATPSKNVLSIRRRGLLLKRGAWGQSYPTPRIYLSDDTNALYCVAGQMILDHGIKEVSILEIVPGSIVIDLIDDPDWSGEEGENAWYTEKAIPKEAIRRVVQTLTREDFD